MGNTERLSLLLLTQKKLANDLRTIGYPAGFPEQFTSLATAYESLNNAFENVIQEEIKALAFLEV